jgi:MFS family permease
VRSWPLNLPRSVWVLEAGGFLDNFGTGLVFPFLVLYLHDVRGLSFQTAGLFIAVRGAVGFLLAVPAGVLVDRLGARTVAVGSLVIAALSWLALTRVSTPLEAYAVAGLIGASNGGFWPAYSTLLAGLAPEDKVHDAFSIANLMRNAAIGLGAVIGGLVASTAHPQSYTLLFVINALSFTGYAVVAAALPAAKRVATHARPAVADRYRDVIGDRGLLAVVAVNASFIATFTAANSFVAPYLHDHAGVSEAGIGLAWAINTAAIVLLQLPVARLMRGRRYMAGIAVGAVLWATSLLIIAAAGVATVGEAAVAMVSLAFVLYAATDCLLTPTQGAMVAQLAPDYLRGRYMAVSSMSWEVGAFVGPAVAGVLYAARPTAMWLVFAGLAAITAVASLLGERLLPPNARRPAVAVPALDP